MWDIIGNRQGRISLFRWFSFPVLFIVIVYALGISPGEITSIISEGVSEDQGGTLSAAGVLAGIAYVLLGAAVVSIHISVATMFNKIISHFLTALFIVPLLGILVAFVMALVLAVVGPIVYFVITLGDVPDTDGAFVDSLSILAIILGMWVSGYVLTTPLKETLSEDYLDSIASVLSELDEINGLISQSESKIENQDYIPALTVLTRAHKQFNEIPDDEKSAAPGTKQRTEEIENRFTGPDSIIFIELSETIDSEVSNGNYAAVYELIYEINEIDFRRHFDEKYYDSLDQTIGSHLSDIFTPAINRIEGQIEQAEHHRQSGKFNRANKNINSASELLTQVRKVESREELDKLDSRISKVRNEVSQGRNRNKFERLQDQVGELIEQAREAKTTHDFESALEHLDQAEKKEREISELTTATRAANCSPRVSQVRTEVVEAEKEAEINNHQTKIAESLGVDDSRVKLSNEDPELYQDVLDLLAESEELENNHPTYPWELIKNAIDENLPGLSENQIQKYSRILSESRLILEFLDDVTESHPSIDAEGWRDAIHTALSDEYPDILKPITSQIERLGKGMWKEEQLHNMSWQEFEQLIGSLYSSQGYSVTVTQDTADKGVDVWMEKDGERTAVQVKQFSEANKVGRQTLQKLVSTIAKGDADKSLVVTSGEFTRTAVQYAEDFGPGLKLIDGEELIQLLSESDVPPPV